MLINLLSSLCSHSWAELSRRLTSLHPLLQLDCLTCHMDTYFVIVKICWNQSLLKDHHYDLCLCVMIKTVSRLEPSVLQKLWGHIKVWLLTCVPEPEISDHNITKIAKTLTQSWHNLSIMRPVLSYVDTACWMLNESFSAAAATLTVAVLTCKSVILPLYLMAAND